MASASSRKVVLGKRRQVSISPRSEPQNLPLVFLQQAVAVVLGVPLEVDDAELVVAHRRVNAGLVALDQDVQAGGFELLPLVMAL